LYLSNVKGFFSLFHGFHKVRTMLRFTIDAGKIDNLEVIQVDR